MSQPRAILTLPGAGRLLPVRLGVRLRDAAEPADAPAALLETPFAEGGAFRLGDCVLELELRAQAGVARLGGRLRNLGARALPIESVLIGLRWTQIDTHALRFLRQGWQSWSCTASRPLDEVGDPSLREGSWLRGLHHGVETPPPDRSGWHESELLSAVLAPESGAVCVLGALETGRQFGLVYLRRDAGGVALEVELRVDAVLAPGAAIELEEIRAELGAESEPLLERFASALGERAGARTAAPFTSGWCSWYHFFHQVSEVDILRNLEALTQWRDEIPLEVVQIDDGYQRAIGDWLETNERFPRGLAPLAADIRSAGFTPGLWTAPFCCVPESRLMAEHPDWLLQRGGEPLLGMIHPAWTPQARVFVLDPGRDEVLAHLHALFARLVEIGFHYLKLDFLYTAAMQADSAVPELSRAQRYRRGLEAIRAGAGEEAFLLGCGAPLGASVGLVDGMRIGADVAPYWEPRNFLKLPLIHEALPSARSAIRNTLTRSWMHRRLWLNDPDCLLARRTTELSEAETRCLASAIGATGGMVFVSDEMAEVDAARRALIRATLETARHVDGLGLPGAARVPDLLREEFPRRVVAGDAAGGIAAYFAGGDEAVVCEFRPEEHGLAPCEGGAELRIGPARAAGEPGATLALELAAHEGAVVEQRRRVPLVVFCDFDGTFSVQDVGSTLARRHAGEKRPQVWARYERGEITPWQYNMEVLGGLALAKSVVEEFLHSVELDPGARDLLDWCEREGIPFRILSDGFDANLNRLQEIHRVRFAYAANHLRYEHGRWRLAPGAPDAECGCGTGICKRGRIEAARRRRPGAWLVHIGNGRVSDLCGALAADVAFAKDSLALELERRGVPFVPFETLRDVLPRLQQLLVEPLPADRAPR